MLGLRVGNMNMITIGNIVSGNMGFRGEGGKLSHCVNTPNNISIRSSGHKIFVTQKLLFGPLNLPVWQKVFGP